LIGPIDVNCGAAGVRACTERACHRLCVGETRRTLIRGVVFTFGWVELPCEVYVTLHSAQVQSYAASWVCMGLNLSQQLQRGVLALRAMRTQLRRIRQLKGWMQCVVSICWAPISLLQPTQRNRSHPCFFKTGIPAACRCCCLLFAHSAGCISYVAFVTNNILFLVL
jgi:hypothetical protein